MFEQIVILVLSLITLVWSADKFVYGASSLASNLGVSPMIIGLTIVAMGSSAPEMMVAAAAAMNGNPDTAVGNAIGSNITNIALVLGMTVIIKPLSITSGTIKQELPLLLVLSFFTYFLFSDSFFSFNEGLELMIGFFIFISVLLIKAIRERRDNTLNDQMLIEAELELQEKTSILWSVVWLVIGILVLVASAKFLVGSSIHIAKFFGVSDLVIGLTVIAIGTSLPELAASIASVLKGEDDLAMGNIIGSNIFNILAVLPFAALIAPGPINPEAIQRDIPVMLGITVLLFIISFSRKRGNFRLTRAKGGLLVLCFISYQTYLFNQVLV